MKFITKYLWQIIVLGVLACVGLIIYTNNASACPARADIGSTTTTASGLQYSIVEGSRTCNSPVATSEVEVHYRGTLLDGTEFDSSYARGQTATFPLNGVISGWTEGLQLMRVGETFKFTIPADLAYGPSERPGIPANSTLIFDVELINIIE